MKRVIIFDWDDTICPSSFVDKWNVETFNELPLHVQNILDDVGKYAELCLDEASKYGEVIIITNSDEGWVKFSAERFVPYLLPCIDRYRIISARTRYERFYPDQPLCWKAAAFAHEVNEIFTASENNTIDPSKGKMTEDVDDQNETFSSVDSMVLTDDSSSDSSSSDSDKPPQSAAQIRKEVISFGDSMEERTAVRIVANQLGAHPKSVMFLSSPTPVQLIGQLAMLTEHMQFVNEHELDLDIEISYDQAHTKAANEGFPDHSVTEKVLSKWYHNNLTSDNADMESI